MSENTGSNAKGKSTFPYSVAIKLATFLDYVPGSIVSNTIVKRDVGTVTMFTFDAGQGISEHSTPFDALVQVLDGEAELIIGGKPVVAKAGDAVIMPANIPHAVKAHVPMKMLLTMIRG
jgi:quercetin dioxygenase-like cupin family protein